MKNQGLFNNNYCMCMISKYIKLTISIILMPHRTSQLPESYIFGFVCIEI